MPTRSCHYCPEQGQKTQGGNHVGLLCSSAPDIRLQAGPASTPPFRKGGAGRIPSPPFIKGGHQTSYLGRYGPDPRFHVAFPDGRAPSWPYSATATAKHTLPEDNRRRLSPNPRNNPGVLPVSVARAPGGSEGWGGAESQRLEAEASRLPRHHLISRSRGSPAPWPHPPRRPGRPSGSCGCGGP